MGDVASASSAVQMLSGYTTILFFVLQFRSNIAYDRWWEGGTLLQKTRGEWFNAYSSLLAFSSDKPEMKETVEGFHHLVARLMSLLFCCALQQVSPCKDRPFEIIDVAGIESESLEFLNTATDKVEVILQWLQRTAILNIGNGVLPVAPPILSRAFQEVSRGIVNLQNARKIADFPFPFPYAQASMVMLLIHWSFTPILCSIMFQNLVYQRLLACVTSFLVVFFVWCLNFIALQLESPFGDKDNDLPMVQMQRDWNKSLAVLLAHHGHAPPAFAFDSEVHPHLYVMMSDGSDPPGAIAAEVISKPKELPRLSRRARKSIVSSRTFRDLRSGNGGSCAGDSDGVGSSVLNWARSGTLQSGGNRGSISSMGASMQIPAWEHQPSIHSRMMPGRSQLSPEAIRDLERAGTADRFIQEAESADSHDAARSVKSDGKAARVVSDAPLERQLSPTSPTGVEGKLYPKFNEKTKSGRLSTASFAASKSLGAVQESPLEVDDIEEPKDVLLGDGWEHQLSTLLNRIKDAHCCMITEEMDLLSSFLQKPRAQQATFQATRSGLEPKEVPHQSL